MKLRLVVSIFSVAAMVLGAGVASGQAFPTKPIRIVIGGSGGSSDFTARLIAPGISGPLGQPVIVDNRGTLIAQELVSKASPDGYNMLISGTSLWLLPLIRKTSYHPFEDFAPITLIANSPALLWVHSSVPAKSVKELIAFAKAKPGTLNYSSAGVGGAGHLSGELLNSLADIKTVHVPYKSSSQRLSDLLSGQVQMTFDGSSAAMTEHIKAGRLRALAVTSAQPTELFPGLPTVAATLPGFEAVSIAAMFAPPKTPAAILNRLRQEIATFINQPDTKKIFFDRGADVVGSTPEQLTATMKTETARWGKVIKDAGIKVDD